MKKFGILGEKLPHSFSPMIHACLGDYEYKIYEKSPEEVQSFLQNGDFDGLNVTIPYKKTVIPYCAELSERARVTGSVNTLLRRSDGTLFGGNTDCDGFAYMLTKPGVMVRGKKALVLGSGGSSLSVRTVLREQGAGEIVVISRKGEDNYQNIQKHSDAEIIVNTTPVGMYPNCGRAPIDIRLFPQCAVVLDLIYNPSKTALMLDAEDAGIISVGGLSMLVAQAKGASELFQGRALPNSLIDEITKKILKSTRNVVLIGMPGCGKTTTGRRLAEITGRVFFDTDEMVEQKAQKPVPDIIGTEGEGAFRALETAVLSEVSAKSGLVIATGGGIVKIPENRRLIRQNSIAVFLDRDIGALACDNRPLSQSAGVAALAAERLPLYRQWGDCTVLVCGVEETARRIKETLNI